MARRGQAAATICARHAIGLPAEAIESAWFDFLARRSPATTPLLEGGELRWKHLLAIQSAITRRLGKADRGEVGPALRRAITSS
jgi:hypothetical protein